MAMEGIDSGSLYRRTQPKSSGLVLGQRPLGAILHSSNEPGELSQWLCHNDSTINIVLELLLLLLLLARMLFYYRHYALLYQYSNLSNPGAVANTASCDQFVYNEAIIVTIF